MQVLRNQAMDTNDILVGDQITLKLEGFGEFTATAQSVTDEVVTFMFDDCVAERQINEDSTNKGGFDASDLNNWIQSDLLSAFPKNIRDRIIAISLPTCGQMFGGNELEWCREHFEDDCNEQFELMKIRRNRVANFDNNDYTWYWLQNPTKKSVSASGFADVNNRGGANNDNASASRGVRPVFWLVR